MKRTRIRAIVIAVLLMSWGSVTSALAQISAVEETEVKINGISRKGQRIMIQMDSKVVEKAWKTYLKEETGTAVKGSSSLPMAKAPKGVYTVEKGIIDTISSTPIRIVSKVEGNANSTMLWWSLDMGNGFQTQDETTREWNRSALVLEQFAKNLYKQNGEYEVEDAEDMMLINQAEANRLARRAGEIQVQLTKSQKEREQLEAALATNARKLEDINKKLQLNQIQQEVAKQEIEILRQEAASVKVRLNTVGN